MRLRRNLLAGVASSAWTALISLAVVPLYLKYLGVQAYGLIGLFVTIQALMSVLDLGLAPTINREVARCSAAGTMPDAARLLHTLAVVYAVVALLIAVLIGALAPWVARHWLQTTATNETIVEQAIMLMGLVIACRWPVGLYQGALMGLQRLTTSSLITSVFATLGSVGAVLVLAFVSASIHAFFVWQAAVALGYLGVVRVVAWRGVGGSGTHRFDLEVLRKVWRFSAGMSGVALMGLVLMYLDKVLLSRLLSLEDFGQYMLATVVAGGMYILFGPIFNVVYPRMSAQFAKGDSEGLLLTYKQGTLALASVLFPVVILAAVLSEDLLYVWTGNRTLATNVGPIVSLLLAGTALNGVMHFPYALQLACGATRLPLAITAGLVVVMAPLTLMLALEHGAKGGAMAWFILNLLYMFFGTWITHRVLLRGEGVRWLLRDVGVPLLSTLVVVVGALMLAHFVLGTRISIGEGSALAVVSICVNAAILPRGMLANLRQPVRREAPRPV